MNLTDHLAQTEPAPGHGFQSTRGHGIEPVPARDVSAEPAKPVHLASAHELLITSQRTALSTQEAVDRLVKLTQDREKPARLSSLTLTAASPMQNDDVGEDSRSFGVYNPSDVTVYLGQGMPARPGVGALSVPPRSLLVLPVPAAGIDVGADPIELAAGAVTVWLLRYSTVQAAFLGAIA